MCGIIGVLFTDKAREAAEQEAAGDKLSPRQKMIVRREHYLFNYLFNSLFYLQMRGQDSVGMCTLDPLERTFIVSKFSIDRKDNPTGQYIFDQLKEHQEKHCGHVGIGHTRWATVGCKNNDNAHPHVSNDGNIAVVHNGHIDNAASLIGFLESIRYRFNGKSDSELLPNYLQYLCHQFPEESFCEIIIRLQDRLDGRWACLALNRKIPDTIFFFKNRMPIVISQTSYKRNNKIVIVSDPSCFLENFPEYICVGDNTVGYINHDNIFLHDKNYKICPNGFSKIDSHFIDFEKNLFSTSTAYTLQNLDNLYETVSKTRFEYRIERQMLIKESRYNLGSKDIHFHTLTYLEQEMAKLPNITLVGIGTSYHSVLAIKNILQKKEIYDNVSCLDALNLNVYDLACDHPDTLFVLVSQTSENKYIEKAVDTISTLSPGSCLIGVFNNILASYVRQKLRAYVLLNSGVEFSLSFVKSFVSQFFTLFLLVGYLVQIRQREKTAPLHREIDFIFKDYERDLHYIIKNQHFFRMVADKIVHCKNVVILGGSEQQPFVLEAAQKFRDIAHTDCFGIHFNQLHHGYFNIIRTSSFILFFHDRSKNHTEFMNTVHELLLDKDTLSTEYKSLIFSNDLSLRPSNINHCDCSLDEYFEIFPLPCSEFHGVNCLVASMYLAYYMAVARNISPDHPRSKWVTTHTIIIDSAGEKIRSVQQTFFCSMQVDAESFCESQLLTYLGNKRKMRPTFESLFTERAGRPLSFLDGFAGSGAVSRFAKTASNVTDLFSNDWECYSNTVNSCYLQDIDEATSINICKEIEVLNCLRLQENPSESFLIYGNYTPSDYCDIRENERAFFTPNNGKIIDRMRQYISKYRKEDQYYFLGPLLYKASVHNNTCGYFNSFYKKNGVGHFGGRQQIDLGRICADIILDAPVFYNNPTCRVQVLQNDVAKIVPHVYVDIAYFDPPYNKHPYGTYYHLLNTIVEYPLNELVPPNLRGQDGHWRRSKFNSRRSASTEFESLVENTNAHEVWVSYNTQGILDIDFMNSVLEKYGPVKTLSMEHPTYAKLLGQGGMFRKKPPPQVREHLFILSRKRR